MKIKDEFRIRCQKLSDWIKELNYGLWIFYFFFRVVRGWKMALFGNLDQASQTTNPLYSMPNSAKMPQLMERMWSSLVGFCQMLLKYCRVNFSSTNVSLVCVCVVFKMTVWHFHLCEKIEYFQSYNLIHGHTSTFVSHKGAIFEHFLGMNHEKTPFKPTLTRLLRMSFEDVNFLHEKHTLYILLQNT